MCKCAKLFYLVFGLQNGIIAFSKPGTLWQTICDRSVSCTEIFDVI